MPKRENGWCEFSHKSAEPGSEHQLNIKVNGFSVNKGGTADNEFRSLDPHPRIKGLFDLHEISSSLSK